MMIDFLSRTILSRVDIFKLDGFDQFCESSIAKKLLQAFADERQSSASFARHIESKLDEPSCKDIDRDTVDSVTSSAATESYVDVACDRLLVHMLNWEKINRECMAKVRYRQFMVAMVYVHCTLNLNYEFPLFKDGQVFNWKGFFEKVDTIDEIGISQLVYPYYQKKDQVGKF